MPDQQNDALKHDICSMIRVTRRSDAQTSKLSDWLSFFVGPWHSLVLKGYMRLQGLRNAQL